MSHPVSGTPAVLLAVYERETGWCKSDREYFVRYEDKNPNGSDPLYWFLKAVWDHLDKSSGRYSRVSIMSRSKLEFEGSVGRFGSYFDGARRQHGSS
jgi:hypothetical protein